MESPHQETAILSPTRRCTQGVSGWARLLAIQATVSLKQNLNQLSAVSPSHLIAQKMKKTFLKLQVCQTQVCSKRNWNLQKECCQREDKQFLPEEGVWVTISCSWQQLHSFCSGHLDSKCHSVMSPVWRGHLLILPPGIHSPSVGNGTPMTKLRHYSQVFGIEGLTSPRCGVLFCHRGWFGWAWSPITKHK